MASTYAASVLQDAIITAAKNETFQKFETRGSVYGALDAASGGIGLLLPKSTIQRIKEADQQATKIDVFEKESEGADTAFACTASGDGATARQTLTWQPIIEKFRLSHGDMQANRYSYEEMFQMRLEEKLKNIYKRIDDYVVSILEANYSHGAGDSFPIFNNAFQVASSNYDITTQRAARWLAKAKADFMKNDFSGDNLGFVGNANLMEIVSSMQAQGNQTATNLGFQFQGVDFKFSNRITDNTGMYATAYGFEKGAFGIIDWIDPLFRANKSTGTDEWTSFIEPRYGMRIALKVTKKCADNTSILTGTTMGADYEEQFQLGLLVSVPTAYSSDAYTYISKYEFSEDDTVVSGSGSY